MTFIDPIPRNIEDKTLLSFFRSLRNSINGAVNISDYSTDERNLIKTFTENSVIFNTDTNKLNIFRNGTWIEL